MGDIDTGAVVEVAMVTGLTGEEGGQEERDEKKENKTHQLPGRSHSSEDN